VTLVDRSHSKEYWSIVRKVAGTEGKIENDCRQRVENPRGNVNRTGLGEDAEAIISVRGQDRYVVMDMREYNRLRVCELEAALYETRQQLAAGEYVEESVDAHLARLRNATS